MNKSSIFRYIRAKTQRLVNYISLVDTNHTDDIPQLFIDITVLYESDSGTGIQRVTKEILSNFHSMNLKYKIVEIYGKRHGAGFYSVNSGKPIKIQQGDFFFGLDLSVYYIPANNIFLKKMKKIGIPVWFFIHDMIPVLFPDSVETGIRRAYPIWLKTIVNYTGIIGNSASTINDLKKWIVFKHSKKIDSLNFEYIHLGSNFGKIQSAENNLNSSQFTFLMVSTVEPRKKYDQCLKAFDFLWKRGENIKLVIVGKPGWNNSNTISMIENSAYLNKNLFWYNTGISDQKLADLYLNCSAVIFASIAEGFGLPIIEAASYRKPLILRDIPVFREIAENNAFYFSTEDPYKLSEKIYEWIELYKAGNIPLTDILIYNWKESALELANKIHLV
jgi:O-antigen biosynthesis alpha-1,2-mannosyltransferase